MCQFMFSISVKILHKCASSESVTVLTLYKEMNSFLLFLMFVALFAFELQLVLYLSV